MERVGGPNTLFEPPHVHAGVVELAIEHRVDARLANQNHGTVTRLTPQTAIPAAGACKRGVDGSGRLWPGLNRPHHAVSDPDAHAKGQGEPSCALALQGIPDEIRGQSKDQAIEQDGEEEEETEAAQPHHSHEEEEWEPDDVSRAQDGEVDREPGVV